MCNMKEAVLLLFGCALSGLILVTSLTEFIVTTQTPLSQALSISLFNSAEDENKKTEPGSKPVPEIRYVMYEKNKPPVTLSEAASAISLLLVAWFSGMFFSTFSRKLAENIRDKINEV